MSENTGSVTRMQTAYGILIQSWWEKVLSTWFIESPVLDADMGDKALEGGYSRLWEASVLVKPVRWVMLTDYMSM